MARWVAYRWARATDGPGEQQVVLDEEIEAPDKRAALAAAQRKHGMCEVQSRLSFDMGKKETSALQSRETPGFYRGKAR